MAWARSNIELLRAESDSSRSAGVRLSSDTPNIRSVRADKERCLMIAWKSGAESVVDVSGHLGNYAILTPLRTDDDLFRKVEVGEWGWCVRWSDDMELSSDTLWRLSLEQGSA